MGGQAAVAVLAGDLADRTTVGTAVALWQLPTILLASWILTASLVARAGWRRAPEIALAATPAPVEPPPAADVPATADTIASTCRVSSG